MYQTIADAVTRPLILYNVPSRTGVNIEPATYLALADHPMIAGIKEANGNISKIVETFALVGDKLDIYSGNDDQVVPILSMGGKGVISVLSNVMPRETHDLCAAALAGDFRTAAEMQLRYLNLIHALFIETNPIPAKEAVNRMGFRAGECRLPLYHMAEKNAAVLEAEMKKFGLEGIAAR